ncbi:MAG: Crp/Fnr family transcriptional regulator [Caulobacteraceae bacterium]|nr:Crp/Fnr family transcriptional regulator [Caulobacteraceae bacterium]
MTTTTEAGCAPLAENNLLKHLRPAELEILRPTLVTWKGEVGAVLYEPGQTVEHTYFPCGATLASFRILFANGDSVETALIGREGAVGGIVSQGRAPAFARAVVQHPGEFVRIETARLEQAKDRSLLVRHLFARYADCLLAQIFQATACNATHNIEQRTAKWLIAAMDRTGDHRVPLTQEQLAGMLGVGRSYINRVVRKWQMEGVLKWNRGTLEVLNFYALKARQCDCNSAVQAHFEEVLAGVYPPEAHE